MNAVRLFFASFILLMAVGTIGFVVPDRAVAITAPPLPRPLVQLAECNQNNASIFGFPAWDACLPHQNGEIVIKDLSELWLIVIPIIESLVRAAAWVAVGMIFWGAILYVKSQGDSGKVTAARETIRDAIIGLVIAVTSVAIIQYVASRF